MCFQKQKKSPKIVFRGSHGVTSDGAQELENDNLHHVSTDWMPALVIFRPNGWVETQPNCTRTSSSFRGQLPCLSDAQAVLHFSVPQ